MLAREPEPAQSLERPVVRPTTSEGVFLGERVMRSGELNRLARETSTRSPDVPRIPASAGVLIFDRSGRLLILKPLTSRAGRFRAARSTRVASRRGTLVGARRWRNADSSCRAAGLCASISLRRDRADPGGARFVFDCGPFTQADLAGIRLQESEIKDHRLAELDEAIELLSGPLRRRVSQCAGREHCVYLEEGRPISGVV